MDAANILAGLAAVLTAVVVYLYQKTYTFWSSRGVKGPTPWPLFGTSIYYLFRDKIDVDSEWTKKYGKTYGVYDGRQPQLRTTDNELIKHIWIKNFADFTDRNNQYVFGHMERWLLFSKGEDWTAQRPLVTPMFTSARMRLIFNSMTETVGRFMSMADSRLSAAKSEVVFSKDQVMSMALDTIAKSFFSIKLDTYKDKSSEFYRRAFAFASFDFGWFLLWLLTPTPIARLFEINITPHYKFEFFDKLSKSTIEERRKNPSKRQDDFIQALMEARLPTKSYERVYSDEDGKESHFNDHLSVGELEKLNEDQTKCASFKRFSDPDIRAQMTFFFLAGFETTSNSISFCLYELAHQQSCQEELHQELRSVVKSEDQLEYSDLANLKKLDAFVSEALRLYSVLTDHNRRVTNKNGVVLPTNPPIKLPPGVAISINGFVLQRDPDYWPEPEKFDMTRFYPENRANIKTCSYAPFGLGPRNCVGMRFALMQIRLFLAKLLLKYRVSSGPKSAEYPPKAARHAFFFQMLHTDFRLEPRAA